MASRYSVRFAAPAEVVVLVDADSQEQAEDIAYERARDRLSQIAVYSDGVGVFADVDGQAPEVVEEID